MLKAKNSLSIFVFLIVWLAVQTAAIHHKFTPEHLFTTGNHLCLDHAGHDGDLALPANAMPTLPLIGKIHSRIIQQPDFSKDPYVSSYSARAPPATA